MERALPTETMTKGGGVAGGIGKEVNKFSLDYWLGLRLYGHPSGDYQMY